ncbi:MAG: arginine repressor [Lachnospiraceae bacterium]|nr:arginine repressor [Lachnospiraceae bacterium]
MPDKKTSRHAQIRRIVENENIGTQEELVRRLNEEGFAVTQATASRDIKELRLTKMAMDTGEIKYVIPHSETSGMNNGKLVRVLAEAYTGMEQAENLLVIKTVSGMAMAAAAALDSLKLKGVVGCIAGDDTIFCAVKTKGEVTEVMRKIEKLIK